MLSRLAFAIATSGSADILIVDEVLAVGDFLFQQKCIDRIKGMMANGTTVLLYHIVLSRWRKSVTKQCGLNPVRYLCRVMLKKSAAYINSHRNK